MTARDAAGTDAKLAVEKGDGNFYRGKLPASKPVEGAEVTVGLPGKGEDTAAVVKTDKDGLTAGYADRGRYSVAARRAEDRAGEFDGKKYAGVRHTATVVFDVAPPGR